jgi:hypothetical protein
MINERKEFADLLIIGFIDYMFIFELERQIPSNHQFTIGQIANRVLELYLKEMLQKYSKEELPSKVNLHPKTLDKKIRVLEQNGYNPSAT